MALSVFKFQTPEVAPHTAKQSGGYWWSLAPGHRAVASEKNPLWKRHGGQPVLVVERSMELWWQDQKDTFASRIFMVTCPRWHLERSGFDAFCAIFGDLPFGISLEGIHRHLQKSPLSQVTLTPTALPALLGLLRRLRLGYMEVDDTRVRSKLDSSNWFRCSLCVRWIIGRFVCVPKRLAWNSIACSSKIWRLCPDISCSAGGWGISIYEAMPQRARTTLTASYTRCSGLVSCQFLESNSQAAFCACRSWNKYPTDAHTWKWETVLRSKPMIIA